MPTYEYECTKCGHNFEVFQSMSDEPLKTCTKCGKEVRRLIFGGAGVIFKGSGFYVTDKGKDKASASSGKSQSKPAETVSASAQSPSVSPAPAVSTGDKEPAKAGAKAGTKPEAKPSAQTA